MSNVPINLRDYFPFYLGTITNRWTAASSRTYLKAFGIGIGEWRVLASVFALGQASSNEIVDLIWMDAGAVSRSIRRLENDGLVRPVKGKFVGRTKPFEPTEAGRKLHAQILKSALEREERLLSNLKPDERKTLLLLMRKLMDQLRDL